MIRIARYFGARHADHVLVCDTAGVEKFHLKRARAKRLFYLKAGMALALPAAYPLIGLQTATAFLSLLGVGLLAFDKNVTKHLKQWSINAIQEKNMVYLDIQK